MRREGEGLVVRKANLIAVVSTLLMAVLVVGCAAGDPGINDGRGDKRGTAANKEETTAPEGDRSRTQRRAHRLEREGGVSSWPRRPASGLRRGLLVGDRVQQGDAASASASTSASPYVGPPPPGASASASPPNAPKPPGASPPGAAGAGGGPGGPPKTLFVGLDPRTDEELATSGGGMVAPKAVLLRLDPQTGEEVATIPLEDLNDVIAQVAFGAGSVWVSSGYADMGPAPKRQPGDVVFRIDPETNRVVDRIPVDPPSGLAFGHGSVWATSAGYGTVSRIDPQDQQGGGEVKSRPGRGGYRGRRGLGGRVDRKRVPPKNLRRIR